MYKNTYRIYDNGYARNLLPNVFHNITHEDFREQEVSKSIKLYTILISYFLVIALTIY